MSLSPTVWSYDQAASWYEFISNCMVVRSGCKLVWVYLQLYGRTIRLQVGISLSSTVWSSIRLQVGISLSSTVWSSIRLQVGMSLSPTVWSSIRLQVGISLSSTVWSYDQTASWYEFIFNCMVVRSGCKLVLVYLQLYGRAIKLQVGMSLSSTVWSCDQAASWYEFIRNCMVV